MVAQTVTMFHTAITSNSCTTFSTTETAHFVHSIGALRNVNNLSSYICLKFSFDKHKIFGISASDSGKSQCWFITQTSNEEKFDRDEIMIGIYRNSDWNSENLSPKNMVKNQKPTMFIVEGEVKQTTINLKWVSVLTNANSRNYFIYLQLWSA